VVDDGADAAFGADREAAVAAEVTLLDHTLAMTSVTHSVIHTTATWDVEGSRGER